MTITADPYLRLFGALQESRTVLLAYLEKLAKDDCTRRGIPYTTIKEYLRNKSVQKRLKNGHVLKQYQYEHLFQGERLDMDISLLAQLITKLFSNLSHQEVEWIGDLTFIRNQVYHKGDITSVNPKSFHGIWEGIKNATNGLAALVDQGFSEKISNKLQDIKDSEVKKERYYMDVINELSKALHRVEDFDRTLEGVIQVSELEDERYAITRNLEMQEDFVPPQEFKAITSKLESGIPFCLIGLKSSSYMKTLLHAIQQMDIPASRCIQMTHSTDWHHISWDEVSLVLYPDPLGKESLKTATLKDAHCVFDMIVHDKPNSAKVVITVDTKMFSEYSNRKGIEVHSIFEDAVQFTRKTTEDDPIELTDEQPLPSQPFDDRMFQNLLEQTYTYLENQKGRSVSPEVLTKATDILNRKRIIRINGPSNSGKSAVAAHLTTTYPGNSFLLQRKSDLRHVSYGGVSVVLIEDFGGKYEADRSKAMRFLEVMDILRPAVIDGKLRLIITTNSTHFQTCNLPEHDMLQEIFDITNSIVWVKPENNSAVEEQVNQHGDVQSLQCYSEPQNQHLEQMAVDNESNDQDENYTSESVIEETEACEACQPMVQGDTVPVHNSSNFATATPINLLRRVGHQIEGIEGPLNKKKKVADLRDNHLHGKENAKAVSKFKTNKRSYAMVLENAVIKSHHVYRITPPISPENLCVKRDIGNIHDSNACSVHLAPLGRYSNYLHSKSISMDNHHQLGNITEERVGYVPRSLAEHFRLILDLGGVINAQVTGYPCPSFPPWPARFEKCGGDVIPCTYIIKLPQKHFFDIFNELSATLKSIPEGSSMVLSIKDQN